MDKIRKLLKLTVIEETVLGNLLGHMLDLEWRKKEG